MKKYLAIVLVLVISVSLLLAACSSPAPSTVPAQTSTSASASEAATSQATTSAPVSSTTPAQTTTSAPATTSTQKFNISFSTYWPEPSEEYQQVYKPILDEIEKNSNGRITFTTYLGGVLGGGAQIYDQIVSDKVDMGATGTGYTPGRFPLCDVYTLPAAWGSDMAYADVANEMFTQILYKDFPDTHPINIQQTEPFFFYFAKKQVKVLADFKGLKIRTPGGLTSPSIQALGGIPTEMALGDVYLSLQTGVVDGAVTGPSAIPGFKLNEVIKYGLNFPIGTGVNMLTMNKDVWAKLPPDLQQIITAAGQKFTTYELQEFANDNPKVMDMLKAGGGGSYTLPKDEYQRWIDALKPVVTQWESGMKAKGLPVDELLNYARQDCAKQNLTFPY